MLGTGRLSPPLKKPRASVKTAKGGTVGNVTTAWLISIRKHRISQLPPLHTTTAVCGKAYRLQTARSEPTIEIRRHWKSEVILNRESDGTTLRLYP